MIRGKNKVKIRVGNLLANCNLLLLKISSVFSTVSYSAVPEDDDLAEQTDQHLKLCIKK